MADNYTPPGQQNPFESDSPTTTRLLKKKPQMDSSESVSTAPLNNRISDIMPDEPAAKKGNPMVYVAIAAGVVIIGGILMFLFLGSGGNNLISGNSNINASGSDSYNAQIVKQEAQVANQAESVQRPAHRAPQHDTPARRQQDVEKSTPNPEPMAATPESINGTSAKASGPSPVQKTESKPAATPPPATKAAATPPPSAKTSPPSDPAPARAMPAAKPDAPKMEMSASLQKGFSLEQTPQVKEGDLVPLTGDVIRPQIVKKGNPQMPPLAKRMRKSGKVIVRVMIDENGNVADVRLVSESPRGLGFAQAAEKAAHDFKYTPARKNNVRVKVWDTIFFTFR